MLCNECEKREFCTQLCEDAEKYVNQDSGEYHKAGEFHLTPTEKKILRLLGQGKSRREVRNLLRISRPTFYFHISNLRKKSKHIVL